MDWNSKGEDVTWIDILLKIFTDVVLTVSSFVFLCLILVKLSEL